MAENNKNQNQKGQQNIQKGGQQPKGGDPNVDRDRTGQQQGGKGGTGGLGGGQQDQQGQQGSRRPQQQQGTSDGADSERVGHRHRDAAGKEDEELEAVDPSAVDDEDRITQRNPRQGGTPGNQGERK